MTDNTSKQIAKNLKRLRRQRNLTQEELARKSKIATNTLARLERAEHTASTNTLEKLAKALKVKVSDILGA